MAGRSFLTSNIGYILFCVEDCDRTSVAALSFDKAKLAPTDRFVYLIVYVKIIYFAYDLRRRTSISQLIGHTCGAKFTNFAPCYREVFVETRHMNDAK